MSEIDNRDAQPDNNKESMSSTQNVEFLESMQEDAIFVMKDAQGLPKKVYALSEKMTVTMNTQALALCTSGRVTHIDVTTDRAWILYRIPERTRPAYGWVPLADISPALTFTVRNDIRDIENEDTVDFIITGAHVASLNLVDGKIEVTPRGTITPFHHPKHPHITGVQNLEKKVTGVMIYSRSADQYVSATVSAVDSELAYFLAEYVIDGQNMRKWLTGDDFTPEIVIKKE